MKQTLNIPFSRTNKTTRRPRRVVWQYGAVITVLLFLFTYFNILWFERNTIFDAAPEDTVHAVQLLITQKTMPIIELSIGSIPLISERDLTVRELAPYIRGELGWFFHKDGSRSIAFHAKRSELPLELLDAKQIVVQEVVPGLFLLSKKLQPIGKFPKRRGLAGYIPKINRHIGQYAQKDFTHTSSISFSKKRGQITITLPKEKTTILPETLTYIPNKAYLVLSTPVFTNPEYISGTKLPFSSMIDPLLNTSFSEIMDEILKSKGKIIVSNVEKPSFLISSQIEMDENERTNLLRSILAIKSSEKRIFPLADLTLAHEFIADPDLVSLEERTIEGRSFQHGISKQGSIFITQNGDFIISDSEELIRDVLTLEHERNKILECDANIGFISLKDAVQQSFENPMSYSLHFMDLLNDSFRFVGINMKRHSLEINLCF